MPLQAMITYSINFMHGEVGVFYHLADPFTPEPVGMIVAKLYL